MPRALISERTILDALASGHRRVSVADGALVTALARDTARDKNIELVAAREAPAASSTAPRPAAPPTTLALGCDHGGFDLKDALATHAASLGWTVTDLGTHSTDSVDYPDYAFAVARSVHLGQTAFGLMIDGVGVGSAMVANKVPGVRAALCPDVFSAYNARAHNDANVLTLGSRTMGVETCKRILAEFLTVPFEGGRHARRVDKIGDVETRFLPNDDCGCHDHDGA
ncbi:MAG: ribose 5-phosphate isomerase B [Bacteroidota bacterium]